MLNGGLDVVERKGVYINVIYPHVIMYGTMNIIKI